MSTPAPFDSSPGTVLVVGAGPGVGAAVARRFARDGLDVALIGRPGPDLDQLGESLSTEGLPTRWAGADLTDTAELDTAVRELVGTHLAVLHFNPSAWRAKDPLELSVTELLADVHFGAGALLTAIQTARPAMRAGARITATGSMAADRPSPEAASLGVQKAAVRNLVHSIDAALAPAGIRAVSVTVRGALAHADTNSPFHPSRVADAIHAAAHQDERDWRSEVPYPD